MPLSLGNCIFAKSFEEIECWFTGNSKLFYEVESTPLVKAAPLTNKLSQRKL